MPALPRPGDRLAGFRIERELGRGTTGVVFLAQQEALDRRVALKVVGRPLADDEAFRARFRHEARTVAGLDHPNVVQILQSGEDDDHLWLAMRYVDGPDLRVLLRRTGRLDPVQAVVVVEQVAAALDAAHAAGVVHRDVSPGNVLIEDGPGRDLHVELADFGLARAPGPEDPGGTPGYAAPEQLAGADATPAADVYGLGCVLYLLLTGVAPPAPPVPAVDLAGGDAGRSGGAAAAAAGPSYVAGSAYAAGAAAGASVLRPSQALPRLGGAFDPAVERATDPDPARRFASAGELAIWARAALTVPRPAAGAVADGPPAADVRAAAALPATPAEVGPTAVTWEAPPRRRRRTRWFLLPLAVLLLAALATAFVFIGRLGTGADDTDRRAGAPSAGTTTGTAGSTPLRTGTTGRSASSERAGSSGGSASSGRAGSSSTGARSAGGGTAAGGSAGNRTGDGTANQGTAGGSGTPGAGTAGGVGEPGAGSSGAATPGGPGGASSAGGATDAGRATPPSVGSAAPGAGAAAALPPVARGQVRFGGGFWSLDLPASEGWRQTSSTEQDGGARIVTRLERPDRVRLLVEQLPGRTAVFGPAPGAGFAVRLPDAGRVTATLFRGGRYALCADACAAVPANGPGGGVLLIAGAHRADGARRLARRAASGLRVR